MGSKTPVFPSSNAAHVSGREMKSPRQADYTNKAAVLYLSTRLIAGNLQFMMDFTNRGNKQAISFIIATSTSIKRRGEEWQSSEYWR